MLLINIDTISDIKITLSNKQIDRVLIINIIKIILNSYLLNFIPVLPYNKIYR